MTVSDKDRDYFNRIGQAKSRAHNKALQAHLQLSMSERLARSWQLYLDSRYEVKPRDDDNPTLFYKRARELGLYIDSIPS